MGRTIHYSFDLKTPLSVADQKKILDITAEYNTKYTWTCENVGFSNLSYYPNWEYFRKLLGQDVPAKDIWALLDKEYKALEKKKVHELDIMANLYQKGFIRYHYGADDKGYPNAQKFHGFTKTAGNEWNSLLVISYIVAISKVVPKAQITVHDEGEFLLMPIRVRNGKAKVDQKDLLSSICYWTQRLNEGKQSYFRELIETAIEKMRAFNLEVHYDLEPYAYKNCISNWNGVKKYRMETKFRMRNVMFRGNKFRPVGDFTRKVNKADFDNHPEFRTMVIEIGKPMPEFNNVMSGFYGEYWNKNHERVELESQQRNKFIVNLLNGVMGKEVDD
jgi:hypothetical protein